MRKNRLIVPVEIDHDVEPLIRFARDLADAFSMELHLLHVVNMAYQGVPTAGTPEYNTMPEVSYEVEQKQKEAAENFLKNLTDKIKKDYKGKSNIHAEVYVGFDEEIVQLETQKDDAGLLMLISDTEHALLDLFTPSTTSFLKHAGCPILVMPKKIQKPNLKNVIYATDYREADITALKELVKMVKPFNSNITAVHITDDKSFEEKLQKEGFQEEIRDNLQYRNINTTTKVGENITETLESFAHEKQAGLIALWKENKNFLQRILQKSPVKELVDNPELPVLVFHDNYKS